MPEATIQEPAGQTRVHPDRRTTELVGEEMGDGARIWQVYDQVGRDDDRERVGNWNRGLDNLALFAGLFSAVTTAFIIQLQNDTRPDYTELIFHVLNASAAREPYVPRAFAIEPRVRTTNCLWVGSLMLSLSAALIAIMGKDWIATYTSRPVCNPRQWAELRTYRLSCIDKWYMTGVIASAPVLLHTSLVLFATGLVLFVSSDSFAHLLALILAVAAGCLYTVLALSAVIFPDSPYKSPSAQAAAKAFSAMRKPRLPQALDRWTMPSPTPSPELLARALSLLHDTSPASDVVQSILVALGALDLGSAVAPLISPGLRTRICSDIQHNWPTADTVTLSRYILADQNLSPWNDPSVHYSQIQTRFDVVAQHPALKSEDLLFAAARLYSQGTVHPSALERYCPETVCQPRALRYLLPSLRSIDDSAAYGTIVIASRYWHHLQSDHSLDLAVELWGKICRRTQTQYLSEAAHTSGAFLPSEAQSERGSRSRLVHILVFLAMRAPQGLEMACFDLLVAVLAETGGVHPCLVYAFGSDVPRIKQAAWPSPPRAGQLSHLAKALPLPQYGLYTHSIGAVMSPHHHASFDLEFARAVVELLSPSNGRLNGSRPFLYGANTVILSTTELCVRHLFHRLCRTETMLSTEDRAHIINLILKNSALVRATSFEDRSAQSTPKPSERGVINILTAVARQIAGLAEGGQWDPADRLLRLFAYAETRDGNGGAVSWDLGMYLRELSERLPGHDPSAEVSMRRLFCAIATLRPFYSRNDELRAAWSRISLPKGTRYNGAFWTSEAFDLGLQHFAEWDVAAEGAPTTAQQGAGMPEDIEHEDTFALLPRNGHALISEPAINDEDMLL